MRIRSSSAYAEPDEHGPAPITNPSGRHPCGPARTGAMRAPYVSQASRYSRRGAGSANLGGFAQH
jgi:hypothetical protein